VDGKITKVSPQPLTAAHTLALARSIMNDKQVAEFERTKEVQLRHFAAGIGRFRVNAFMQQGKVGMVLRVIPPALPTIDGLGVPQVLQGSGDGASAAWCILVGATGSGKSTTLAAMVDWRNENSCGHIVTIEDPVEFVHPHKNCVVTQREVGLDTDSWEAALKNTLRQAPDVILMGEIRDRETMEHAVAFAETGHLCLATLHANSANQATGPHHATSFPKNGASQLLMDLSLNLKALVSQRLVPRQDGKGRVAAVEMLLNSPLISDLIFKGEVCRDRGSHERRPQRWACRLSTRHCSTSTKGNLVTYARCAAQRRLGQRPATADQTQQPSAAGPQDLGAGTENLAII